MVRRQIDFDEETDQHLTELARDYEGDVGKALSDLLRSRESLESFLDQCEESDRASLQAQKEKSERAFAEGRVTRWDDVKRINRL